MKQDRFVAQYAEVWARLDAALKKPSGFGVDAIVRALHPRSGGTPIIGGESSPKGAIDDEVCAAVSHQEIPMLYRRTCQHLALARERGYSLALVERLQTLCLRGHQRLYARHNAFGRSVVRFILTDFPASVRAEWRAVLVASLLLCGSGIVMGLLVHQSPAFIYSIMDVDTVAEMESMYDPSAARRWGRERESAEDFLMFGFYLRNNTSIGFRTFAGGLVFGLGSAFFLLFNGILLGGTAGYLTAEGAGLPFWSFVVGHSAAELSAIVLSGAAGLVLGWSLLAPGRQTRQAALVNGARRGLKLLSGAAGLFFVAAVIEAYWSSLVSVPAPAKWAVGVAGWVLVWGYLLLAGRD